MFSNNEIEYSKNIQNWEEMIVQIFPRAIPDKCIWKDEIDILNILFSTCHKNLNNIFYPDGKTLNLFGVDFSMEDECIELITEKSIDVVKPIKLSFNFYKNDYLWSYFRLETSSLPSISNRYNKEAYSEKLFSLENGEYNRYIKKSAFLIFPKKSLFKNIYNKTFNSLSEDELRLRIEDLIKKEEKNCLK